jgi:RNA polymerase sigma-70 factor (ECF subfamily)
VRYRLVSATSLPPFWLLVADHGAGLLRHAEQLVGPADAEDIVHDALLRALRAYPRLVHAGQLRAWLHRVLVTTADDARRARRREVLTAAPPERPSDPAHYDDAFASLVANLPEARRVAVTLRFVEDLDYEAIGRRLGCSPRAARQGVSSGVRALREEMTT